MTKTGPTTPEPPAPAVLDGPEDEAERIRRSQAGDREAFGMIVKRYAGAATGVAYLMLGCHADALDASQEAFVRAWRNIRRFRVPSPFYPWYSAILRNVCRSRLRRRRRTVSVDAVDPPADEQSDPAGAVEKDERREIVRRAILALSPAQREIIVMSHFQEMSYKQMAAALDVPIGTVMSRLYHARRALKAKLTEDMS